MQYPYLGCNSNIKLLGECRKIFLNFNSSYDELVHRWILFSIFVFNFCFLILNRFFSLHNIFPMKMSQHRKYFELSMAECIWQLTFLLSHSCSHISVKSIYRINNVQISKMAVVYKIITTEVTEQMPLFINISEF